MVQLNKYYKSRAVGVKSEIGLTTDRDLAEPLCLRNTTSFILPQYWKSCSTSHYTTVLKKYFFSKVKKKRNSVNNLLNKKKARVTKPRRD